ncbi:hypothetical protein ASG31_14740 [Chryseobacterium sp. Leaf404]|uniref:glycosyltransferase family 2 protein n=1 Tax=unclassified Chryseobacterium TaxID=2593645 RepID=UPI0006F54C2A|nr:MULTISPECIES: glycosyltransferase family 2 protein [unclassified Chryseobacterium]KQT15515.1 hypothetical protein ASG31_14740 [Chryseobacterium sp. Leaf404]
MLAIIIPYYKINFFQETLKSVESQTDRRFTVYIGNDASPDNPESIIKETLQKTEFKYIHYQENFGGKNLTKQWDRVINEIENEEWIMILGDDDVLEPNVVKEFYKKLDLTVEKKISLVKFSQESIDEFGHTTRSATELPQIFSSKNFLIKRLTKSFPSSLSENIFSRKMYEKYNFKNFPLAWHSDDLAMLEFADLNDFIFINNAKIKVRISSQSISGQDNNTTEKQFAHYLFCEYILKNYIYKFPVDFISLIVKRYRENIWRNGFPLNIDLTDVFFKTKQITMMFYSFKIKYDLKKRIKILKKK